MSGELWLSTLDRLIGGITHELNGRASALRGISYLARSHDDPETWLPLLLEEADALARSAAALEALRAGGGEEPLDPRDAVAAAALLVGPLHITLAPAETPGGVDLAVRADRSRLVRALAMLVLLLVPDSAAVTLGYRFARERARVGIELLRPAAPRGAVVAPSLPGWTLEAIQDGWRLWLPAVAPAD